MVDRVLLDARLAIRGLGMGTFVERLISGFAESGRTIPDLWEGSGGWSRRGVLTTLTRSGLFDVSPRLDPRTRRYDVVHFACNVGSLLPGRNSVITVHDLFHRQAKWGRRRVLGSLLEAGLPRAGRVAAVSRRTLEEVEQAFPQLRGKVELIPSGMRRIPVPSGVREHVLAFGGAADPRKRTDLMVEVYREYRNTTTDPLPLVVLARAGLTPTQRQQLEHLGARIIRSASPPEVDDLMARAGALLYTTIAEGFGLPVLEAAEMATPVVMDASADIATEVVGAHCIRVEALSVGDWAAGLRRAVDGGSVPDAVDLPGWPEVATAYHRLYEEVAGK